MKTIVSAYDYYNTEALTHALQQGRCAIMLIGGFGEAHNGTNPSPYIKDMSKYFYVAPRAIYIARELA
jgi:hypothetical protein